MPRSKALRQSIVAAQVIRAFPNSLASAFLQRERLFTDFQLIQGRFQSSQHWKSRQVHLKVWKERKNSKCFISDFRPQFDKAHNSTIRKTNSTEASWAEKLFFLKGITHQNPRHLEQEMRPNTKMFSHNKNMPLLVTTNYTIFLKYFTTAGRQRCWRGDDLGSHFEGTRPGHFDSLKYVNTGVFWGQMWGHQSDS